MLKEHKLALIYEEDLKQTTKRLEDEERERHQQRLKEIASSEKQAQLFLDCVADPEATEAAVIARAYCKTWAASYGIDLEELRQKKLEERQQVTKLMEEINEEKGAKK